MMPRPVVLLILLLSVPATVALPADDFSLLVSRHRSLLLAGPVAQAPVETWAATQRPDGTWPDFDYGSTSRSAWPPLDHLRRAREIARAWARSGDPALERAALAAIGHWSVRRYQNSNWWQNEIGVPQAMRDLIVLLGDRLEGETLAGAMAVLRQSRLLPAGDGANTIWSAELALMIAALERDPFRMDEAACLIAGEVRIGGRQGIQHDYSFHQHGPRLQQFHYGLSYLQDTVRLAWLLRETPWALSGDQVNLLAALVEQGTLWMCRGRATAPGTLDRAVSRPGNLAPADLGRELALLADLLPAREGDFAAWGRNLAGGQPVFTGFRAFPDSDFAVYHQNDYSFFLKTISLRTQTTESFSAENLRGRKLHWGDHYLVTGVESYTDLPPVWDWELLPGVTSARDLDTVGRRAFAGAVGEGESGAVAMDHAASRGGEPALTVKKFWAMHRGVVVSLRGAVQRSEAGLPVRTALDQRRLRGAVTVADALGLKTLPPGEPVCDGVRWVHHDGLLYVPLGTGRVSFRLGPVGGAWSDINGNHSAAPVTEAVFLPFLEHGDCAAPISAGFAVLACATPAGADALLSARPWAIVRNDADVQAVRFADGAWMAAFHAAGQVEIAPGRMVAVDAPGLLVFDGDRLLACDPAHAGRLLRVTIDGAVHPLDCPPRGRASAPVALPRFP